MANDRGSLNTSSKRKKLGKPVLKRVKIDPAAKSRGRDYMNQLDKAAEAARQGRQRSGTGFMLENELTLPTANFATTEGIGDIETPNARRLREVKDLIVEERYKEALEPLRELLDETPGHQEAIYFKAYCLFGCSEFDQALRTLLPLRRQEIKKNLKTRIRHLGDEIRSKMIESVLVENYDLLFSGKCAEVISNMSELVTLDPDASTYHHMLAGAYTMTGDNTSALQSINTALDNSDLDDPEQLESLRNQVYEDLAAEQLVKARELYKKRKYSKARQEIEKQDPQVRQTWIANALGGFLEQCEAGHNETPPSGNREEIDALYEFLIAEELHTATQLYHAEQYQQASHVLQAALAYTPSYAYGSYICAACVYDALGHSFQNDESLSFDDVNKRILLAQSFAKIGASDPGLEGCAELLETIEKAATFLKQQQKDAKHLERVFQEFNDILESAKDELRSVSHCDQLTDRLTKLSNATSQAKGKVESDTAKQDAAELLEATKSLKAEIKKIRRSIKQAEILNPLIDRFTSKIQQIKGGINQWEVSGIRSYFQKLRVDIQTAMKQISDKDAREQATGLLKAVDDILRQLRFP